MYKVTRMKCKKLACIRHRCHTNGIRHIAILSYFFEQPCVVALYILQCKIYHTFNLTSSGGGIFHITQFSPVYNNYYILVRIV